jgi:replicative DNA helicase
MTDFLEDLTQEERDVVDGLVDVDTAQTAKYKWDEEFQREILALLLADKFFLTQCVSLIKPGYFVNEVHQLAARIAIRYFTKYKSIISKTQLHQEMNESLTDKDEEKKAAYRAEIATVLGYYVPGLDSREYYQDKITNFAKQKTLQNAFSVCLDKISKNPEEDSVWAEVQNILREAMTVERNFDIGLDYFKTFEERYERMKSIVDNKEVFTSGFPAIDKALACGGLTRGEMGSWMGLSGTGKSLALVRAAISNMARGKKVVYVSLEIDQDKTAERFDAQLANDKEEKGVTVKNLYESKSLVFDALREYVSDYEDQTRLVVKQFPAGAMDVATFRAYFVQLALRNFRPDLVIIDYIGEMKDFPKMATWESRYRIVRDLRGFAVEEQVCVLTAMQPDRRAREAVKNHEYIDDENLADSYGQVRPLDGLWSINQMQDEKDAGLARIFVVKHRHGRSRFAFHVEFNYSTLGITEITQEKYENRLKKYRNEKDQRAGDEVAENELNRVLGKKKKKSEDTDSGNKSKKDSDINDVAGKMFSEDASNGNDEALDKEEPDASDE